MTKEQKKIFDGLISDGGITVYFCQKYINENPGNILIGLAYLNQANTFFTAAKTIYYEHESEFYDKKLQSLFYEFGNYNKLVLKSLQEKDFVMINKQYDKLLKELEHASKNHRIEFGEKLQKVSFP